MIFSFLGCCSALMEHSSALYLFIGTQVFLFILTVIGSATDSSNDASLHRHLRASSLIERSKANPREYWVLWSGWTERLHGDASTVTARVSRYRYRQCIL
uniref:Uncharacterized protein n=1 Tax=Anopheles funestus TaxID=62324 RepID=A0A4Y0BFX9_ANOFN